MPIATPEVYAEMLDRAKAAGCHVQQAHVLGVDTSTTKPRYSVEGEWRSADFLVLAAGARNQIAPETRPLQRDELEMTQGYFVPQTAESITVKFLPHFEGYIWSFPRCDHLSVGICGSMAAHTSAELKTHLSAFMGKHKIPTEDAKFYSHVLPSPRESTLSDRTVLGKNWALVGDAAAWVDPLTGEGLSMRCARANCLAARSQKAARKNTWPGSKRRSRANWNSPRASCGVSTAVRSSGRP